MTPHREKYFRYRGRSMWPCFQEGDLLEIEAVSADRIRPGDCLLFPDHDGQLVVHRLIARGDALQTRGDATAVPDAHRVSPEQVRGRVVFRYRLERRSRVTGGRLGLLAAVFYRYAGRIDPTRTSRGGRVARAIRRLSTVVLKPVWTSGEIRRMQSSGQETMVIWALGRNVIGQQDPRNGEWHVRWPWRVFVDPAGWNAERERP